jgi:Uncharacterised protein family (UPF0203)
MGNASSRTSSVIKDDAKHVMSPEMTTSTMMNQRERMTPIVETPCTTPGNTEKDRMITEEKQQQHKSTTNLSGMSLVHYVCRKRKKIYEECVSHWYSQQFMVGRSINQEEVCGTKFELYRKCLLKGIKQEVWDKQYHLPPPQEDSPLMEYEEEGRRM